MAYFYTSQAQQRTPQETIAYPQPQSPQHQYTQQDYPQQQQSYYDIPSNILRPNMGSRNSAAPYPVPQHDTSYSQDRARRNSQTQALASASRSARQCPIEDYKQAQRVLGNGPVVPPPSGPTNHVLVPQPEYFDERDKKWRYGPRYPPITFQTAGFPEIGVRVSKIAHSHQPPPIEGANDEIFAISGDREVQWPGYSSEPLKKRIKTQGGKIIRQLFLTILAHDILDFTYDIHRKRIPIEPGYEKWMIGSKAEVNTIVGGELFITRVVHRGGSNWQVELWAPKRF
ncbi:hypothetical protein C0995_000072 [Termitomyces sp. Mi166|nr:hypothetical protein C0995_000072 [Termitomyces sp. Mi166\